MKKEKTTGEEILLNEWKKIIYWGQEIEVKTMWIRQIMMLLKIVSKSEKVIRLAMAKDIEDRRNNWDNDYSYLDIATVICEQLEATGDLYKCIGIILSISEQDAQNGFKMSSLIDIINIVIEQEEIEKIFLWVTTLAKKLNPSTVS